MAFWTGWFQRIRGEPKKLPTGRVTKIGNWSMGNTLSPYRSRTTDILDTLRLYTEESSAIDFARKVTPDVSMAVWNFVRLANQGHQMEFYAIRGKKKRLLEIEELWRDQFASRVNEMSNAGLDGLIDIFHQSAFTRGAQGCEVEVNAARTDIVDVYPVIPQTIEWELEKRNNRKIWIPYQQQVEKRQSLEKGVANFFWVPTDPDIDDPRGNLILAPVLQSVDFQLQIMQDLQAVLHHQGWPQRDIAINLERMLVACPPHIKADLSKLKDWLEEQFEGIRSNLRNINPDDDLVHFDDITVNPNNGGINNAVRSLDVRAIAEVLDVQVLNGAKQMGILTNRVGGLGQTESWGSITFKIFCSGIVSCQRGSKRLLEEIARLWLRVKGIQATPTFTHNTIDWNSEEQRWKVRLMEEQFWAIAQLMGWVDGNQAAQKSVGSEKAAAETPSESVRVSLSIGGDDNSERRDNKKTQTGTGGTGSQVDIK